MLRRERWAWIIVPLCFMLWIPLGAHSEVPERLYPLPLAEMEKILSQWLIDSGFEVIRREKEGYRVQLKGLKDKEIWDLNLRHQSPLASWVQAHHVVSGQASQDRNAPLWNFLEDYLKEDKARMIPSEEVPSRIMRRMESIACVKANNGREAVQFTGFVIDRKGLILSTAHDLKGVQEVTILLSNGQVKKGTLTKIDLHRDLTLIDIRSKLNASIPLHQSRNSLQNGEKVFAIGCLGDVRRVFHGTIDGPVRWVNNLPLFQTAMEIQPGSSGSPVFDGQGNFVATVKGRYRGVPSTGFLIPLRTILDFLKEN